MAEFLKAEELKSKYQVKGRFYNLRCVNSTAKCRSLLTITDSTVAQKKKLLVVMLNPGSSRPLDKEYLEPEILATQIDKLNDVPLVDAKPDATQYQIMRVMYELNFSYAEIINLFDIREPKQKKFIEKVKKGELPTEASILADIRQTELNSYFMTDTTVILAWGNLSPIMEIEEKALDKISKLTKRIFAVRGKDNRICHPSPPNHKLKIKWLDNICEQLRAQDK